MNQITGTSLSGTGTTVVSESIEGYLSRQFPNLPEHAIEKGCKTTNGASSDTLVEGTSVLRVIRGKYRGLLSKDQLINVTSWLVYLLNQKGHDVWKPEDLRFVKKVDKLSEPIAISTTIYRRGIQFFIRIAEGEASRNQLIEDFFNISRKIEPSSMEDSKMYRDAPPPELKYPSNRRSYEQAFPENSHCNAERSAGLVPSLYYAPPASDPFWSMKMPAASHGMEPLMQKVAPVEPWLGVSSPVNPSLLQVPPHSSMQPSTDLYGTAQNFPWDCRIEQALHPCPESDSTDASIIVTQIAAQHGAYELSHTVSPLESESQSSSSGCSMEDLSSTFSDSSEEVSHSETNTIFLRQSNFTEPEVPSRSRLRSFVERKRQQLTDHCQQRGISDVRYNPDTYKMDVLLSCAEVVGKDIHDEEMVRCFIALIKYLWHRYFPNVRVDDDDDDDDHPDDNGNKKNDKSNDKNGPGAHSPYDKDQPNSGSNNDDDDDDDHHDDNDQPHSGSNNGGSNGSGYMSVNAAAFRAKSIDEAKRLHFFADVCANMQQLSILEDKSKVQANASSLEPSIPTIQDYGGAPLIVTESTECQQNVPSAVVENTSASEQNVVRARIQENVIISHDEEKVNQENVTSDEKTANRASDFSLDIFALRSSCPPLPWHAIYLGPTTNPIGATDIFRQIMEKYRLKKKSDEELDVIYHDIITRLREIYEAEGLQEIYEDAPKGPEDLCFVKKIDESMVASESNSHASTIYYQGNSFYKRVAETKLERDELIRRYLNQKSFSIMVTELDAEDDNDDELVQRCIDRVLDGSNDSNLPWHAVALNDRHRSPGATTVLRKICRKIRREKGKIESDCALDEIYEELVRRMKSIHDRVIQELDSRGIEHMSFEQAPADKDSMCFVMVTTPRMRHRVDDNTSQRTRTKREEPPADVFNSKVCREEDSRGIEPLSFERAPADDDAICFMMDRTPTTRHRVDDNTFQRIQSKSEETLEDVFSSTVFREGDNVFRQIACASFLRQKLMDFFNSTLESGSCIRSIF